MSGTFRLDCHVHTCRYSTCSSMSPEEACSAALARGLDALVLTEHHRQWRPRELETLRRAFPGLALYTGAEITLAEGHDVVVVGDAARLELAPGCPLADLDRAIAPVRKQVFTFVAHAFRWADTVTPEAEAVFRWADGLEMNSINILRSAWRRREGRLEPENADLYAAASSDYGLLPLFNSDAHHVSAVGCIAGELPGQPPDDVSGLALLLRNAMQTQIQNSSCLAAYFY